MSAAGGGAVAPEDLLDSYAASFADGGRGSEFFRLAVEAVAPSVLDRIGAILTDDSAVEALRLQLAKMVGDTRFRGDPRAVRVLVELLGSKSPPLAACSR